MSASKDAPISARQRLFLCRKRIDKSPGLLAAIEIALGTVAFAHALIAIAMLWSEEGQSRDAVLPLAVFCFEVALLSLAVLVLVIKDICTRPEESLSVWQREALGRLLRNIVIWSLIGVSCLWLYEKAEEQDKLLLSGAVVPALVAACLGMLKIVLIRTERTWFWLGLSLLFTLQMMLLLLKIDFNLHISWRFVCLPIYFISLDALVLTFTVSSEEITLFKASIVSTFLSCLIKFAACVMVLITTFYWAGRGDGAESEDATVMQLGIATFILCYASAVRISGNYLLNIVWGHVEIDFLHQKYPALLARRQTV
jgi:hypothetical protein